MNNAELKSKAKLQIQGKIGVLFVITLIISLISAAISSLLSILIPGGGALVVSNEMQMPVASGPLTTEDSSENI